MITDKRIVDHINNIRTDNRLDNLQLITQSENLKKDHIRKKLPPIKIKAINIKTGESFDFESISKAGRDLNINTAKISDILNGTNKTSLSKKYKIQFRFEKI